MKPTNTLFAFILLLLLSSCNISSTTDEIDRKLPRELSVQEQMLAGAANDFSFRMLQMLRESEGDRSFFVSPLSISMAFGMALNGTEGDTYEQMRDFFGFDGMTNEEINAAFRDLIELLTTLDPKVVMNIANSVWIREGYPVLPPFLESNRNYFNAEVQELDFGRPDAADEINSWIEEKTRGLIDKMIEEIGADVIMYLINAIYFKGDWTVQFDPKETRDDSFYLPSGGTINVPMMRARQNFRYYQDNDWTALDLWYGKEGFSFTALIPTGNGTLGELTPKFTMNQFEAITNNLIQDTINVFIPKFELDYEIENFPEKLKDMGLTLPFDQGRADFSRITKVDQLFISNVLHRAVIKLDEEGSEAAAVTVIEISRTSAGGEQTYISVRLDRPFLFFIRENNSNTILFMGAYTGIE